MFDVKDNVFPPITFEELIQAVRLNASTATPQTVRMTLQELLHRSQYVCRDILEDNMEEIIKRVEEGR